MNLIRKILLHLKSFLNETNSVLCCKFHCFHLFIGNDASNALHHHYVTDWTPSPFQTSSRDFQLKSHSYTHTQPYSSNAHQSCCIHIEKIIFIYFFLLLTVPSCSYSFVFHVFHSFIYTILFIVSRCFVNEYNFIHSVHFSVVQYDAT